MHTKALNKSKAGEVQVPPPVSGALLRKPPGGASVNPYSPRVNPYSPRWDRWAHVTRHRRQGARELRPMTGRVTADLRAGN